jgi:uncharacterized SAM-binding protein YcdF (DUF218 family)
METWSITWALRNLLAELLMPPGIWVVLISLTFFFIKNKLTKNLLIVSSLLMVWIGSTNYFANQVTNFTGYVLDWPKPLSLNQVDNKDQKLVASQQAHTPQAIIVLGGDTRMGAIDAPEDYQEQDVSAGSMERLRYGARLAKVTQLSVLLTGGAPDSVDKKDIPEAVLMSKVLQDELGIQSKWIELGSNTTQENARQSSKLLKQEGIQIIYLVTHFWHMPRAKAIFEKEGFHVVEAPMGFYQKKNFTPLDFYPSSEGFQRTRWIFHEILGSLWYGLKF